jgi:hypothetical protein
MLRFLKNNGFPVDLEFDTFPYHDDREDFHGWKSKVYVNNDLFTEFCHANYGDRIHWANGFLSAYEWEKNGKFKWRGKKDPYNEQGELEIEVGDWIVDKDGKVRRVDRDSQEDLPYENIQRHAREIEVENASLLNKLIDKLEEVRNSNRSAWNTYGSELCAGSMIKEEEDIEKEIQKLRDENN